MDYIPIDKNNLPNRFDVSLLDEMYTFEVHYNMTYDFFTVTLERNGEVLAVCEKLVYGMPLFYDIFDPRFPAVQLVPFDESEVQEEVTFNNFGESVFLYILEDEEEG